MEQVTSVSLYHRTIRDPQSITKSIYGHFSADKSHEYVISRSTFLELISYNKDLARWDVICSMDTHSFIRDLCVYPVPGSKRNYVLVGTDTGCTVLLKYNTHKARFESVVCEPFGRSGIRRTGCGQYVAADPYGRSILVAALERTKIVYEMTDTTASGAKEPSVAVSSGVECSSPQTVTYAIKGVYFSDSPLGTPIYAAIEASYADATPSSIDPNSIVKPLSATTIHKRLTFYQHDTSLRSMSPFMSLPVPASATDIISLPVNAKYPGGVLVLCENCLLYYPVNEEFQKHAAEIQAIQESEGRIASTTEELLLQRVLRVDYPTRVGTSPKNIMISSHTVFSTQSRRQNLCFVLLQTELGDVFKLDPIPSQTDRIGLSEIQLFYFDTLPVATSLSISDTGFILATSDVGDTSLLRVLNPAVEPTDPLYCKVSSHHYHEDNTEAISRVLMGESADPSQAEPTQSQLFSRLQILLTTSISSILPQYSDEERSQMAFYPLPLQRLAYRATIPSLSPLRAAAIYDPLSATSGTGASLSSSTIYTAVGAGSRSMVIANKLGVVLDQANSTVIGHHISDFYAVTTSVSSYNHTLLMVCLEHSSLLLSYSDELGQMQHPNIVHDEPTLLFASATDPQAVTPTAPDEPAAHTLTRFFLDGVAIVQATPRRLRCITAANTFSEWRRPPNSDMLKLVGFNGNNLFVAVASSYVYVLVYSPSHGQTSGLIQEVVKFNDGFVINRLAVLQPANGVIRHAQKGSVAHTTLRGGAEMLFAISGLDNVIRFYVVKRHMDSYMVELVSRQSIPLHAAGASDGKHETTPGSHQSISSLLMVDRGTFYECFAAYDNYVSIIRVNTHGEVEHVHHYFTGLTSLELTPEYIQSQQQQAEALGLPAPASPRGSLKLSILVNPNSISQDSDAVAHAVDVSLTNGMASLIYRFNAWTNINVSSSIPLGEVEYVMEPPSTKGDYSSGSFVDPHQDAVLRNNNAFVHSSLSAIISFNPSSESIRPIILASSSVSQDNIGTHQGSETICSVGSSNLLICNEIASNTHPNMPTTQLLRLQSPDESSNHHLSPRTASLLHNNSYAHDQHHYSDEFMVSHASPITFTPRQLHVLDVSTLLRQHHLTSTFKPDTYAGNQGLAVESHDAMGDDSSGVSKRRMLLPRDTILDDGTYRLTEQTGSIVICVEGDTYTPPVAECEDSYSTGIENFYKPLMGWSGVDEGETPPQLLSSLEGAPVALPYPVAARTNLNTHVGSNLLEHHTGYPRGELSGSYRGLIRLLTPHLQTVATISTPSGFTITCSTLVVFQDFTCLVVGGNFSEVDPETGEEHLVGGILTYALYQYHDRGTIERQQQLLNACSPDAQAALLSSIVSSPTLSSIQWHIDLIHVTKHPMSCVRALTPITFNRSLLVALNDSLCIYEYGKKRLLFKSKFPLQRGMISSLTCSSQYNVLNHTDDANLIIYVGFHGQGITMVRLSIRLTQPSSESSSGFPIKPIIDDPQSLRVVPPPNLDTRAASLTSTYDWALISSTNEQRYVLSCCPVPGGVMGGDRFGNIFLVSPDQDQVVSSMYNPLDYNKQSLTLAPSAQALSGNSFGSLSIYAETHLGSPITNVFSLGNGKKVLYTALDGRIGVLSPINSPFTHNIMHDVVQTVSRRPSLTNNTIRKFSSYFAPTLNIIHGDQFIRLIRAAAASLSAPALPGTETPGSDSDSAEFIHMAKQLLVQVAGELETPILELVRQCLDLDSTLSH